MSHANLTGPGSLLLAAALAGGCGSTNHGDILDVGGDEAGSGAFSEGDAGGSAALDAYIEEGHVAVRFVTLSCSGRCANVEAVGTGGHPPYTFAWDNGSSSATRQVCPTSDASYHVKVTDTGNTGEVPTPAETVEVPLEANVIACPDASAPGPSVDAGTGCDRDAGPGLPVDLTPDINDNAETYFAAGADLPAGPYRVTYVDGCIRYDPTIYWWAVNGSFNFEYMLAGATTADAIQVAPGVVSLPGNTSFDDCVAASQGLSVDITLAGGKLGIYNNDFKPSDNLPSMSGENPTWRLERLCP